MSDVPVGMVEDTGVVWVCIVVRAEVTLKTAVTWLSGDVVERVTHSKVTVMNNEMHAKVKAPTTTQRFKSFNKDLRSTLLRLFIPRSLIWQQEESQRKNEVDR